MKGKYVKKGEREISNKSHLRIKTVMALNCQLMGSLPLLVCNGQYGDGDTWNSLRLRAVLPISHIVTRLSHIRVYLVTEKEHLLTTCKFSQSSVFY